MLFPTSTPVSFMFNSKWVLLLTPYLLCNKTNYFRLSVRCSMIWEGAEREREREREREAKTSGLDRDLIWPALLVLTSMSSILWFSLMQQKLICAVRSGLGGLQWTVPILLPPLILLTMNSFPPINANLDVRKCKLLGSKSPEWLITKYLPSLLWSQGWTPCASSSGWNFTSSFS